MSSGFPLRKSLPKRCSIAVEVPRIVVFGIHCIAPPLPEERNGLALEIGFCEWFQDPDRPPHELRASVVTPRPGRANGNADRSRFKIISEIKLDGGKVVPH